MAVRYRVLWIGALVVWPILTLAAIITHGENVPFWDDWTMLHLFQAHDNGHLGFDSFWSQHNEHRPVIPKALDFGQALITGWDIKAELYRNFLVAVATFVVLVLALRRTLDRTAYIGATIVASVVFFSPMQWENWLWGWQLEWFLSTLGAVVTLWALTFLIERSLPWGIAVGIVGALVATFSLGQGLLMWPVGLAVLLLRRRPWRAWAEASVLTTLIYFQGYKDPAHHPDKLLFLERPVEFLEYVCLYLGRSFGLEKATGIFAGALLILTFLVGSAYVLKHRDDTDLVDRAAFWLGAGAYSLGAAIITAISRLGFGLDQAASSRYAGMSALFGIATLGVVFTVMHDRVIAGRPVTTFTRRRIMADLAVPLLLIAVVNTGQGMKSMDRKGEALAGIAECTRRVVDPADPCLKENPTSPYPETVAWILYLREKGWAGY